MPYSQAAALEAASMGNRKAKANYRRTVLRLPDLDHSKSAVLNSLTSPRTKLMTSEAKGMTISPLAGILRRLGSYSRKNKLYFALRELAYVVRTMFLLRYISEAEPQKSATNKSERFNEFVQWISFGR